MKCSWEAERSLSTELRHLVMNSLGVMGPFIVAQRARRWLCEPTERATMAAVFGQVSLPVRVQ